MSEEEKLQLENECLLKYSKAQMIQKYIDELEENKRLNNNINKAIEIIDIYGTYKYETADLLYSALRGSD